jgi:hypothetical protein
VRLTIKGTNFVSGITAKLQNASDTINLTNVTFYTSTTITAFVPVGAEPPGNYNVVVTNPDGGSGTWSSTYLVNGTTTVSSFGPASGLSGNDVRLTIYGTNFKTGITAKLQNATDTINLTNVTFYSSTTITAVVPSGSEPPGSYNVVVTNSDGFSGTSSSTYLVDGSVTVGSIGPTSGWNQISHAVTIRGANFKTGITARLQNATNTINMTNVTFYSSTTITAVVPSGAAAGVYDVVLTNTDGGSGTLPNGYTVTETIVLSTDPNCGDIATTVLIFGTEFGATQGTSSVSFNGTAATSIGLWSNNEIDTYVPTGATTGPVTVTRAGVQSNGVTFTVSPDCGNSGPTDYDITAFHVPEEVEEGETQQLDLWVINENAPTDPGATYTVVGNLHKADGTVTEFLNASGTVHDACNNSVAPCDNVSTDQVITFTPPTGMNEEDCLEFTATLTDDDPDVDQVLASGSVDEDEDAKACKGHYKFKFISPPNADSFAIGDVIPIEFTLVDRTTGDPITDANAYLWFAKQTDHDLDEHPGDPWGGSGDSGNQFRFDPGDPNTTADDHYVFNWDTTGLTEGTWRMRVDVGDGKPHMLVIKLKP